MEALIFKFFGVLFRLVGVLIVGGLITVVLLDLQKKAFDARHNGLTSMLKVNQQLVGKTK